MEKTDRIIRNISIEAQDHDRIAQFAVEKGFGKKGFSAAIRFIVRDWFEKRDKQNGNGEGESAS